MNEQGERRRRRHERLELGSRVEGAIGVGRIVLVILVTGWAVARAATLVLRWLDLL